MNLSTNLRYVVEIRREDALHYANILLLQRKGSFAVTVDSKKLEFVNFWMSENTKKILNKDYAINSALK